MKLPRVLAVLALAAGFGAVPGGGCTASAASTAGLVIETPTQTREFCVELDGEPVTGLEMLHASGAEVVVQDWGTDVTICRIDGVGCDHPTEPCFCSCATDGDGSCTFWGVYTMRDASDWRFAEVGIGQLRMRAGDVLGLRWGVQSSDGGAIPRVADPGGVCARAEPIALGAAAASTGGSAWPLAGLGLIVAAVVALAARRRRA